jgi:hypothetical protein
VRTMMCTISIFPPLIETRERPRGRRGQTMLALHQNNFYPSSTEEPLHKKKYPSQETVMDLVRELLTLFHWFIISIAGPTDFFLACFSA